MRHPSRRRSAVAVALLVAVVAGMALAITRARSDSPEPGPTPSATVTASSSATPTTTSQAQPTMLVQLRDDYLSAVDNVLIGNQGPKSRTDQIYFPADLIVDLNKGQSRILQDTGTQPLESAGTQISAQSGAQVGGTFVMDRLAFAGLVDAVGGVTLDIKKPVVAKDGFGNVVAIVPLGTRTLDGPSAAVYAMYLPPGAPESDRIARFQQVWLKVLAQLPPQAERVRAILGSLGALARSTQPVEVVASFLAQAGANVRAAAFVNATAPTSPGAVGPLPASWIRPLAMADQVARMLPWAAVAADSSRPRVAVHQSGANPVAAQSAKGTLESQGFAFVWSGPARADGAEVAVAGPELTDLGARVASALGLPPTAVVVAPGRSPGTPVTVYFPAPSDLPAEAQPAPVTSSTP